ncbi:retrovirus-related pol polyprotein from transposon TNT 1-94 [Tanacetum coccineum]
MTSKSNNSELTMVLNSEIAFLTLIEAARTMLSGSVFSKQYWTEAVATACYTQNRSTIVKRHLKTPYEIFRKRIPNINFLHVFGCPVYIHNHKDHLGKFDEKADDGYLLGYSLVSKAFRVFNTRRQQTEETYHITFDESLDAIKFLKPSVDNINIAKTERYPPDEYLHPYEPSQRNKRDETGIVIKNKARLVAQSYNQQKDIDYDETFALVARLEAIKIFPAFFTYMNFIVYQMDVKSAFLNGKLKEEVYVKQPPGFKSNEFPNHVCKLDKALYGLKQAPRACKPDIQFSTCLCARYQANLKESHLIVVKRIFMYLKEKAPQVPIFCENTSAIAISNNPVLHLRTKHIYIRYHFIRDHVIKGDIELHFIPTQYQLADIFTKPLDEPTFKRLIVELGMLNVDSKPEASALPEEN